MLQIDHIYHFFYDYLYRDFFLSHFPNGVPDGKTDLHIYIRTLTPKGTMLFYDQEPLREDYLDMYKEKVIDPEGLESSHGTSILVTSEKSSMASQSEMHSLYYFYHGFAALDWFRGYRAMNYKKQVVKKYDHDFISFNRIVTGDRMYRQQFIDLLRSSDLLNNGTVSYGVTDDPVTQDRLVIDQEQLSGDASASIPLTFDCLEKDKSTKPNVDAFWHIVTETVFYYDKLHLTEKIFKPIVSKQPFMLLAAPGNLEYLRSYGFKTFEGIIDESYDKIKDNDARINAVVEQIKWYCSLSDSDKFEIQRLIAPVVEHNFHHFYGKFREIITDELLDNTKKLFKDIDYDDSGVDYDTVRQLLIS